MMAVYGNEFLNKGKKEKKRLKSQEICESHVKGMVSFLFSFLFLKMLSFLAQTMSILAKKWFLWLFWDKILTY